MPTEKHQKQAREAVAKFSHMLPDTQAARRQTECVVAAALESAYAEGKRGAGTRCAEIGDARTNTEFVDGSRIYRNGWRHCAEKISAEIRAEFGIEPTTTEPR